MQNSMVLFGVSVLGRKLPFRQKSQDCRFQVKYVIWSNSKMQNSMILLTFSVLDRKLPFWANLVQTIKGVSLRWNLVLRLIRRRRIQWCFSLFLLQTGNTLVLQICSKKSKLLVQAEIWYLDWLEHAKFNAAAHFFCFKPEAPFLDKFGPKYQNCLFKLKFLTFVQNSMTLLNFCLLDQKHLI